MQSSEFSHLYEQLCHAFDKEFKDGQALIYFKYLQSYSKDAFQYAIDKSILFQKFPRLPLPAELIDLMHEYRETIPAERQLNEPEFVPITEETMKEFREVAERLGLRIKGVPSNG